MPWSITVMVLGIILIVNLAIVMKARYKAQNGIYEDEHGNDVRLRDPNEQIISGEVKQLKERIAVLERVITDERGARELDREIEKLRGR